MASAATVRSPVFAGDAPEHLDMLVNACEVRRGFLPWHPSATRHTPQTRFERPVNPSLFGRPLQPYDFGGMTEASQKPTTKKTKKQHYENTPPRGHDKPFAGPGLYASPPPSAVPMPPAFLLSNN